MTLRTLNYGNYGIFLIMGNDGQCRILSISRIKGFEVWGLGLDRGLRG